VDPTTEPNRATGPTDTPVDPTSGDEHPIGPDRHRTRRRTRNQAGEGVISTAIAVLVVAFIGIGLWRGFDLMVNSASQRTRAQVEQIGR